MNPQIRRIRPNEWHLLRELRLQALADAPLAFAATLAQEEAFPEKLWRERAVSGAAGADRITFIAEDEGQWIGLATGIAGSEPSSMLVGMFVTEPARGRGIGIALVESIVGWAQSRGAARLVLWVTASNEVAIALYRGCGFRPMGITRPLAHTPTMIECEMVRALNL